MAVVDVSRKTLKLFIELKISFSVNRYPFEIVIEDLYSFILYRTPLYDTICNGYSLNRILRTCK